MLLKTRILAVALVVLGTVAFAWAQEAEAIKIQFRRPEKVGDRCLVETGFDAETFVRVDALTAADMLEDIQSYEKLKEGYKFVLKRTAKLERQVTAVDRNQRATHVLMKLTSMSERVSNEKGGAAKFEDPIKITGVIKPYGPSVFTGGRERKQQNRLMSDMAPEVCMGLDAYDFDAVYGTTEKKKPGDTWPVNAQALKDVLDAGRWKVEGPLDITGEVKFVKVAVQASQECAIIEAVTTLKNVHTGLLKQDKELDKAEMVMTVRVALPLDAKQRGRVLTSAIKGKLSVPAATGRNAITVDLSAVRGEEKVKVLAAEGK